MEGKMPWIFAGIFGALLLIAIAVAARVK